MSYKTPLPGEVIRYEGLFNYEKLLRTMRNWLRDQGYEFNEGSYKHKVPGPAGYEQELKWTASRKVTGYTKFNILIYMKFYDIKDVEVVKDNEKKPMNQARLFIELNGDIELDYNNYFESNNFLLALRDWINKYLLYAKLTGTWQDELYYRLFKLHRLIKETLGMTTTTDASRYKF